MDMWSLAEALCQSAIKRSYLENKLISISELDKKDDNLTGIITHMDLVSIAGMKIPYGKVAILKNDYCKNWIIEKESNIYVIKGIFKYKIVDPTNSFTDAKSRQEADKIVNDISLKETHWLIRYGGIIHNYVELESDKKVKGIYSNKY